MRVTFSLLPPPSSSPSLSHCKPQSSLSTLESPDLAPSLPTPRQRPRKKDKFFPAASNLTPWRRCRCSCSPLPPPPSPPELSHSSLSLSIGRTVPLPVQQEMAAFAALFDPCTARRSTSIYTTKNPARVQTSAGPMIMRVLWRIYRVMALVDHKILYYIRSICLYKKL